MYNADYCIFSTVQFCGYIAVLWCRYSAKPWDRDTCFLIEIPLRSAAGQYSAGFYPQIRCRMAGLPAPRDCGVTTGMRDVFVYALFLHYSCTCPRIRTKSCDGRKSPLCFAYCTESHRSMGVSRCGVLRYLPGHPLPRDAEAQGVYNPSLSRDGAS